QRFLAIQDSLLEDFHLVDLITQERKHVLLKGKSDCEFVFSPLGTFVFLAGVADYSYLLATASGKILHTCEAAKCIGFVPHESLLLYEIHSGTVNLRSTFNLHIWNTRTKKLVKTVAKVCNAVLSPDGRTVAAIVRGSWTFLDLATFEERRFASA